MECLDPVVKISSKLCLMTETECAKDNHNLHSIRKLHSGTSLCLMMEGTYFLHRGNTIQMSFPSSTYSFQLNTYHINTTKTDLLAF